MSQTQTYLEAIITLLKAASYGALARPVSFNVGPVPPVFEYPAVGVLTVAGESDDGTLDAMLIEEEFQVVVLMPVELGDSSGSYLKLLSYRDIVRDVIYDNFELGGVQAAWFTGWTADYTNTEDGMGFLQAVTVTGQVRYQQT